jgi:hypothetical protein
VPRSFWIFYLYVLMPGVFVVGLFAVLVFHVSLWVVAGVQLLASLGLVAVVVRRLGWDSLGETRAEILDRAEEEEEAKPLPARPGEFTSAQMAAKFDRSDGNRPDSPGSGPA